MRAPRVSLFSSESSGRKGESRAARHGQTECAGCELVRWAWSAKGLQSGHWGALGLGRSGGVPGRRDEHRRSGQGRHGI